MEIHPASCKRQELPVLCLQALALDRYNLIQGNRYYFSTNQYTLKVLVFEFQETSGILVLIPTGDNVLLVLLPLLLHCNQVSGPKEPL